MQMDLSLVVSVQRKTTDRHETKPQSNPEDAVCSCKTVIDICLYTRALSVMFIIVSAAVYKVSKNIFVTQPKMKKILTFK